MKWELVGWDEGNRIRTERLMVPGGWLVRSHAFLICSGVGVSVHTVFVADASHDWKVLK